MNQVPKRFNSYGAATDRAYRRDGKTLFKNATFKEMNPDQRPVRTVEDILKRTRISSRDQVKSQNTSRRRQVL